MEAFSSIITSLENWIWGAPMLILLCGTHIFMTLRTGFIQKKTFTGIRLSVTKDPDSPGDVSQFQALTTALASTIGTGNIIGVGTAIYLGGPGAVLWCWLTGVFGIATKYAESLIAVKYRVQTADGRMMGGAMYALERGLKWKKFGKTLAMLFALFAMLASFGIGCGTQINAIAEVIETNLPIGIPRIAIGIVFGIVTAIIILGGIYSGLLTATESSAIAVVWSFIAGMFIYRELKWSDLFDIFVDSAKSSAMTLFIIATSTAFAWLFAYAGISQKLVDFVIGMNLSATMYCLVVAVILLIFGTFLEGIATAVLLVPVLWPVAQALGVNVIHFGMIVSIANVVGTMTPPVAVNIFSAASVTKLSMGKIVHGQWPFFIGYVGFFFLVVFIPALSTFLL